MCAFQAYWSNQVGEDTSVRTCKNGAEDVVTEFNVGFWQLIFWCFPHIAKLLSLNLVF